MRRTIHGVHLCWGTYGFWLPNDPRGSGSETVWADHLKPFGDATFAADRKRSRAKTGHDRQQRWAAKRALMRPPVLFDGYQAKCAALAFGEVLAEEEIPVWACTVLPDHVHLVVGPSSIPAHMLAIKLKRQATIALVAAGLHPFGDEVRENGVVPHCWQEEEWKVFEFSPDDVRRVIRYVEANPLKEGKPRQVWPFVTEYTGDLA